MSTFRQYDPQGVTTSFKKNNLVSPSDGSFIKATRYEDNRSMHVGANGDVTSIINRNRTGSVELALTQGSESNDVLSAILDEDEREGTGVGELQIVDANGTTVLHATNAWIKKWADVEFANGHTARVWTIDCAKFDIFVGGLLSKD
jgi:hypothetical protein